MPTVTSLDDKGRVTIPVQFREELGEYVVLTQTKDGVLLSPGKAKEDNSKQFLRMLDTEPRRTGKPTNPSPTVMKSIWREEPR